MSPWWSQVWIGYWGPMLFHSVFWPLTCLGLWAARPPRLRLVFLGAGMVLGVALLGAGLVAAGLGQPSHVWGRLLVFGGVFEAVHTSLLVAMVFTRREVGPAQTGGMS